MDKASIKELGGLHGFYTQTLISLLERATDTADPEEVLAILKEVRMFLKDNDIKAETLPEEILNIPGLEIDADDIADLKR